MREGLEILHWTTVFLVFSIGWTLNASGFSLWSTRFLLLSFCFDDLDLSLFFWTAFRRFVTAENRDFLLIFPPRCIKLDFLTFVSLLPFGVGVVGSGRASVSRFAVLYPPLFPYWSAVSTVLVLVPASALASVESRSSPLALCFFCPLR